MIDLDDAISEILTDYTEEVKEKSKKAASKAAKDTAEQLKSTSPKDTGDYAEGWTTKKKNGATIVYNKKKPALTHLLEYGHLKVNQYGTYGMSRSFPHIKKAEQAGIEEFEMEAKDEIENI